MSAVSNESMNSKFVISLVVNFLRKRNFSIGITFVTQTTEQVTKITVAEAEGVTTLRSVVETRSHVSVEINC